MTTHQVFWIGHGPTTDAALQTGGGRMLKPGKGSVGSKLGSFAFLSVDDAKTYLAKYSEMAKGYKVYGYLELTEADTEQLDGEPFRRTLKDAWVEALPA